MSEKAALRAIIVLCTQVLLKDDKCETVNAIYKLCSDRLHIIIEEENKNEKT